MTRGPDTSTAARATGSVSVELVVLAPVVIAVLCLVVGLGRIADADGQVSGAARDAARAASLTTDPVAANQAARGAAAGDVVSAGIDCAALRVATDTARFSPGGEVSVTVACTARLAGLAMSGLPGAKTLTATATAPIDRYTTMSGGVTSPGASTG
jgi:Flp pilus assembly protein TadG